MAVEYLRPQQAADGLGISRMTLYRWIRQGRIRVSESAHKHTLVSSAEVERVHRCSGLSLAGRASGHGREPREEDEIGQPKVLGKSNVEYLRRDAAAQRLGVSTKTLDRYIARGLLRCSRPSSRVVLISSSELARFYNANVQPVPVP